MWIYGKIIKSSSKSIFIKSVKNSVSSHFNPLKAVFIAGFIIILLIFPKLSQKVKAQNSKTISVIIIDNGLEIKIETAKRKVEEILKEAKITFDNDDLIFPDLLSKVDQNYKIFIYHRPVKKVISNYTVKPGDTISSIAKKFKITWNTIKWANNLEDSDKIFPGQTLTILPTSGILHIISKGETLKEIALKYKGNQEEIIKYNQIKNPEDLTPGEKIIIPQGKKFEPPKKVILRKNNREIKPKINSKTPLKSKESLTGIASWYSWKKGLGCASLKFPLGSRLKVTNLKNGASVEVIVNDRGPYNSRIIDLTKEAFSKIAPLGSGVIKVKIEKIK